MGIGALFMSEGELSQKKASELSRKICALLPSASVSLPEILVRLVDKDCYKASTVIITLAERVLRWPTTM